MWVSELAEIVGNISECQIVWREEKDRELTWFAFLSGECVTDREDCLYIGEAQEMKRADSKLVLLTTERPEENKWPGSIFFVPRKYFAECMNEVTKHFFEEQRREHEFEKIAALAEGRSSIKEVLNRAAVFMDRSLVLIDLSFRVLGYSTDRAVTDQIWKEHIFERRCSYEFVQAVSRTFPNTVSPDTAEAFPIKCMPAVEKKLCSLVFYERRPIGYLVLIDNEKGVLPYHLRYLPRFSGLMSETLKRLPDFHTLLINGMETYLLNMLRGVVDEKEEAGGGPEVPGKLRSVVFLPKSESVYDLRYLQRNLQNMFPAAVIMVYEERMDALFAEQDVEALGELQWQAEFAKYIKRIGVSPAFENIREFAENERLARKGCEIAEKMENQDKLCFYEDYRFIHILLSVRNDQLLRSYIHPALEQLHVYDLTQELQLLNTLRIYVKNGRNGKKTAAELYLHRNTLNYRLSKIKKVTEIDFENEEEIFRLHCSFYINQILHLF